MNKRAVVGSGDAVAVDEDRLWRIILLTTRVLSNYVAWFLLEVGATDDA